MSQIDRLCGSLGIRFLPPGYNPYRRKPRWTCSRRVIRKLRDRHGEGHVLFVLRTIVESENNAAELFSDTILAVSDVVRLRPDFSDKGLAFIEAFDDISLAEMRDKARKMRLGGNRAVMRVLIAERLERALAAPESQGRLL